MFKLEFHGTAIKISENLEIRVLFYILRKFFKHRYGRQVNFVRVHGNLPSQIIWQKYLLGRMITKLTTDVNLSRKFNFFDALKVCLQYPIIQGEKISP